MCLSGRLTPFITFINTRLCMCAGIYAPCFVCVCAHVKADALYSVGVLMTLHNH